MDVTSLNKLRERAERYLRDDADGDLDAEKWGEAMPPGDVVWLIAEVERLRSACARADRERDVARRDAAEASVDHALALARTRADILSEIVAARGPDIAENPAAAVSITDKQIRELRDSAIERRLDKSALGHLGDRHIVSICDSALDPQCQTERRNEARARCAEIINARGTK